MYAPAYLPYGLVANANCDLLDLPQGLSLLGQVLIEERHRAALAERLRNAPKSLVGAMNE